jgi:hypothetical protein
MEQLLVQADNLHKEAALLSNTLHQFADADIDKVKPVVAQILAKRQEWKRVKAKIDYFKKTGKMPEEAPAKDPVAGNSMDTPAIAELKVELGRIIEWISKTKKKLELKPDHKKAEQWREAVAKNEAMRNELRNTIVELRYAAKQ